MAFVYFDNFDYGERFEVRRKLLCQHTHISLFFFLEIFVVQVWLDDEQQ